MHKINKTVAVTLFLILLFTQPTLALETGKQKNQSKPTEGIESTYPNHGSSWDTIDITLQSSGLIKSYACSIHNNGSSLSLTGVTTANFIGDEVRLTLYLQKWQGTRWVDVKSFTYNKYNTRSLNDGDYIYSYERGNYYRTRAVHYVRIGSETDTRTSTSSYIYID